MKGSRRKGKWLGGAFDCGDGHGGDAFAAADRAEAFVGGRFEADAFDGESEGQGEALADGVEVRADLGLFGDEGGVDVVDGGAAGGDEFAGVGEDFQTADAADGFIGIGEMVADVAFADGTKKRSIDKGDTVALALRRLDLTAVYTTVASATGTAIVELRERFAHLNPGMQRMNLGNMLRRATR